MSNRQKFRNLLLIGFIALALLVGAPIRPDQIEQLLQQTNRPKIVHVLRREADGGEPEQPLER